ncbi:MAG: hypothetical protein RBU30_13705, partial [Polyangia bacterium]|nr:hypothetical protein [Polyangia bacterium]
MFLTKIWSVLVTLWAVAVTAAFLLSTAPAEFELREAYVRSLDGAQGLVDNQLRTRSRLRLDFFSEVGKDYKIVKLLKQLKGKNEADGQADSKELTAYAQGKLVGAGGEAAFRKNFDIVAFTDADGRAWARLGADKVWGRLGAREGKVGDKIQGFPGVKRALTERVCADNTLDLGGVLHFVWACPVRYVKEGAPVEFAGAVMGIKEIDDSFALSMLAVIGETDAAAEEPPADSKDAQGAKD